MQKSFLSPSDVDSSLCREIIKFQPLPMKLNVNENSEGALIFQLQDEELIARVSLNFSY